MKKIILKITPVWLLENYRKIKVKRFKNKSTESVFTEIYKTNYWKSNESISGEGSELKQVELLIKEIEKLIIIKNIKSVLDIPCGDFNWMKKVDLSKVTYIGGDIVEDIIKRNTNDNKEADNISFQVINLINDQLPNCDLIIVRDCLVHLSYDDIFKAIKNIKSSGCKYLFTTTYPNHKSNYDIITGDWRRLNLLEKPFNFPKPTLIFNENCTEGNGEFADKSMVLWEINNI